MKKLFLIPVIISVIIVGMLLYYEGNKALDKMDIDSKIEKLELAENEMTDGRIVLTVPEGFECRVLEPELVEDCNYYLMITNEACLYYGFMASLYDVVVDHELIEKIWETWLNDYAKKNKIVILEDGKKTIGGREGFYRIGQYSHDGNHVYVRMYLIRDEKTNQVSVAVFYDNNTSTEYVDVLLENVRFI